MSWKPQVIADNSGLWVGNGLRFATKGEAEQNALDLACKWTAVRKWRVIKSNDPVNCSWQEGILHHYKTDENLDSVSPAD